MQLNQAEIIQQNQQKYLISGAIDFSTLPGLMQSASDFFKAYKKSSSAKTDAGITMDLSKTTVCNSAGLALILEMVKQADNDNIQLSFENLPGTLLTIAKAYGAEYEIRDFT